MFYVRKIFFMGGQSYGIVFNSSKHLKPGARGSKAKSSDSGKEVDDGRAIRHLYDLSCSV
jgi:hypothetical protein